MEDGLWPIAWGAFGCCCVICYTIYKLRTTIRAK